MSNVALEGYCPVAYFLADKPLMGIVDFSSEHQGKTYHFVSEEAKAAFDADPNKFVPQYGGACAFGMSIKENFPVDPTNYKVVDGRLFLFLKNDETDALKLWNDGNEADLIAAADEIFANQ